MSAARDRVEAVRSSVHPIDPPHPDGLEAEGKDNVGGPRPRRGRPGAEDQWDAPMIGGSLAP